MILVIGCGFVGEAVAKSLEEDEQKVVRIDPKLNDYSIKDYLGNIQGAIVCVPTPTVDGKCDDSIVRSVIDELRDTPTMLKSTVPPHLVEQYPENVVYSPEFLRASSADEDFKNQKYMILGGKHSSTLNWTFKQMFSYLDAEIIETDRKTASMVKYVHNAWLATKVAFFHELFYNIGKEYDHDSMIDILSTFENIGPSHMAAPNDEGLLGYGGHCFPKDTAVFRDFTHSDIMKQVIETNVKLRAESDRTRNNRY